MLKKLLTLLIIAQIGEMAAMHGQGMGNEPFGGANNTAAVSQSAKKAEPTLTSEQSIEFERLKVTGQRYLHLSKLEQKAFWSDVNSLPRPKAVKNLIEEINGMIVAHKKRIDELKAQDEAKEALRAQKEKNEQTLSAVALSAEAKDPSTALIEKSAAPEKDGARVINAAKKNNSELVDKKQPTGPDAPKVEKRSWLKIGGGLALVAGVGYGIWYWYSKKNSAPTKQA